MCVAAYKVFKHILAAKLYLGITHKVDVAFAFFEQPVGIISEDKQISYLVELRRFLRLCTDNLV